MGAARLATTRLDERRTRPLIEDAVTRGDMEAASHQPPLSAGDKRDPLIVLILGFVTCYFYLFYWWYMAGVEIKRATGRADINPPLELVLNLLTCSLFTIYLSYKYPKIILEMQEKARVVRNDTSLVSMLLSIFSLGPIACYVIQADLNKIWETVESAR